MRSLKNDFNDTHAMKRLLIETIIDLRNKRIAVADANTIIRASNAVATQARLEMTAARTGMRIYESVELFPEAEDRKSN